jgi:hypothetical protein
VGSGGGECRSSSTPQHAESTPSNNCSGGGGSGGSSSEWRASPGVVVLLDTVTSDAIVFAVASSRSEYTQRIGAAATPTRQARFAPWSPPTQEEACGTTMPLWLQQQYSGRHLSSTDSGNNSGEAAGTSVPDSHVPNLVRHSDARALSCCCAALSGVGAS